MRILAEHIPASVTGHVLVHRLLGRCCGLHGNPGRRRCSRCSHRLALGYVVGAPSVRSSSWWYFCVQIILPASLNCNISGAVRYSGVDRRALFVNAEDCALNVILMGQLLPLRTVA